MSGLFEGTSIRQMKLPNRFVRSATCEGMAAEDGICTPALREKMVELAAGGVSLIITSHSFVSFEGRTLTPAARDTIGCHDLHTEDHDGCRPRQKRPDRYPIGPCGGPDAPKITGLVALGPSPLELPSDPAGRRDFV